MSNAPGDTIQAKTLDDVRAYQPDPAPDYVCCNCRERKSAHVEIPAAPIESSQIVGDVVTRLSWTPPPIALLCPTALYKGPETGTRRALTLESSFQIDKQPGETDAEFDKRFADEMARL